MGNGLWFLIVAEPGDQPYLNDTDGLTRWLQFIGEDRGHGWGNSDAAVAWLWNDSGQLVEVTPRCIQAGELDTDDRAGNTWAAFGPDGTEYARVTVMIDGRA